MKNSQYLPLKKRSISCRATCYHKETGNKFFAWGYGRSKKSAKADVKRHYASARSPYLFTNLTKGVANEQNMD